MKKYLLSKRCGTALPLTTVVIMLLYALGIALLSLGLKTRIYAMRMSSDITARCAADAGLTIALYEMNQKLQVTPWDDSSLPQATNINLAGCDNEICTYTVTNDLNGDYKITSTGGTGQMTRGVSATLELQGLFEHAILTKASLVLKSGTLIDGYNSLDPLDNNADVDIGTQSTADSSIILNSGVTVNGDIVVGMGGNPSTVIKDLGATTTGAQFSAMEEDYLPEINAPSDLFDMLTDISVTGATTTLTPADNGKYSQISIKNGT